MLFALGCGQIPFKTANEILNKTAIPWELYKGIAISESFKNLITQML